LILFEEMLPLNTHKVRVLLEAPIEHLIGIAVVDLKLAFASTLTKQNFIPNDIPFLLCKRNPEPIVVLKH
jgi:hypothetical protein